jgi:glucose/arabinose dehydrogenase
MRRVLGLAFALVVLATAPAAAAPALKPLGTFSTPVGIAGPPGDASRVTVVEKPGVVRLIRNGVKVSKPFLDVTSITRSTEEERGLLSIAFPPDYQSTGLFYVFLTAKTPLGEVQIREFHRADADHAAPGTGRIVFSYPHASPDNHNGGQLQFGPDGLLWFTIGDAATAGNAQNTSIPLGKLNRIDPRPSAGRGYTIPANNPFGSAVWSYGLRNPWRFSFDRATGDLLIGDVGQNQYEEIDYVTRAAGLGRGADYGWDCREGFHDTGNCSSAGSVDPLIEQTHGGGWEAIIGGYVVRDPGLPTLAGRYLYGDLAQPRLHLLNLSSRGDTTTGLAVSGLTALGQDACGHLYTAELGGRVAQVVDGASSPCSFPGTPGGGTGGGSSDTTKPKITVKARGTRLVTVRHWLQLTVKANERSKLTISGRMPGVARFRTLHRSLKANRSVRLKLRLTRPANRKVRHAVRGARSKRVRLRIRAVDAAGNARTLTRRVRISR